MANAAIEDARRLLRPAVRREEGRFLAEGPHVVQDALDAGAAVETVFVSADRSEDENVAPLVAEAERRGARIRPVQARDLLRIADTEAPQGIVAIVRRASEPAAPFSAPGAWLVLDGIQDPGNVGTLLRSAEAFGARGVLAGPGTADLWSGKVIRAAQGAHFRLTLLDGDLNASLDAFAASGGTIWTTAAGGENVYEIRSRPALLAILLGNEARGVSEHFAARASKAVAVPQPGRAESLNVAMAGTVVLSWVLSRPRG